MFTYDQIHTAHSKVRSGADFPQYIRDLIQIGVVRYVTFVADGHTNYEGKDGFQLSSPSKYESLEIATQSDADQFVRDLRAHQGGQTDYPAFCRDCAKSGVEKWIVDMRAMTCTYYDTAGQKMLIEPIPQ